LSSKIYSDVILTREYMFFMLVKTDVHTKSIPEGYIVDDSCKTLFCVYFSVFSYESIIATLCESLDTLDEPEAKVLANTSKMIWKNSVY